VVVGAAVYAATVSFVIEPVRVRLTTRLEGAAAGAVYRSQVGLVQALARPAAVDLVLEKGTEVGASFFVLVQTAGSPKRGEPSRVDRLARWRRIVREAAKQSKQVAVPDIVVATSVDDVLGRLGAQQTLSVVLEPDAPAGLQEVIGRVGQHMVPPRIALWVGPEAGWTPAEMEGFSRVGAEAARLGRSVLRTETAGPVAVAVARLVLGDW
jgi:16S rRNA (uracil1498-N3)-methyltransferase